MAAARVHESITTDNQMNVPDLFANFFKMKLMMTASF
jgi:hypothetical protein